MMRLWLPMSSGCSARAASRISTLRTGRPGHGGTPNATEAFNIFAIIVSRALSISPTMTTNIKRRCLTSSDGSDAWEFCRSAAWADPVSSVRSCAVSRIVGWSADWKGGRKYPVDMAGFGFNAALLSEITGDLWAYRGRGGETEFIERLIGSADQLELLCNNCRDCYVWHDLPIGWSTRLGLIAYLVRRRAPAFMRRKLNRAFRKIWLTEGKLWL